MDTIWIELVIIAVGLVLNGFFAASEIALVSSRTSRLVQLQAQGRRGAARALALKQTPDRLLASIQVAITLVSTLAAAVGGAAAAEAVTPGLERLGAGRWAEPLALAIVVVVITYASLVVGELVPKAIAMRDPEGVASRVSGVIAWVNRVAGGLVTFLSASTQGVLRLLGLGDAARQAPVSEEEVRYLIREGAATGVFGRVEEELVHKVFDFADTRVVAIMTPRSDVEGIDIDTPPDAVLRTAAEIGHSRIPVYRGSIDNPVGVLTLKDLLAVVARQEPIVLAALVHSPLFVPETAPISVLLREFQRTRQSLAFVVDEYGAVAGLVTIEDVLEEIVGELREEREDVAGVLARQPDGSYVADGDAPIREVSAALGLRLPPAPGYQTVAGLVIEALGSIPTAGTSVVFGGWRWTVLAMEGPRITGVKIERER